MSDGSEITLSSGLELWISAGAFFVAVVALVVGEFRSKASVRLAWNQAVIGWAERAVRRMTEAQHLLDTQPNSRMDRLFEVRTDLSSLIDEGRFFFENNRKTTWGADKDRAYQGYRPILLDCLVSAYDRSDPNSGSASSQLVLQCKRKFVSEIQALIDPEWFAKQAAVDTSRVERKN